MPKFENQGFQERPPAYSDEPQPAGYRGAPYAGPSYAEPQPAEYRGAPYAGPSYAHHQTTTVMMGQPGSAAYVMEAEKPPQDWLACSILACIFCSCSVGVCAIHHSCKSREMLTGGRMTEARVYSSAVVKLLIWALVLGLIGYTIWSVVYFYLIPKWQAEAADATAKLEGRSTYYG